MSVTSAPASRPTRVRHLIVAAATLMSFLLYLDRFCVSFAVDYIRQDLNLTQDNMKWFLSAFFWSYALAQVPSGWFSDRYGARIMLVIYILTWSLFTGLIGASYTFLMLIATRLLCGLGQAGAYPTAASVVGRWVPISARGTASSFVGNGGRIGGAAAPVLTAYLIVMFVPMGTPVEFAEADLLLPRQLVEHLSSPAESRGDRTANNRSFQRLQSLLTDQESAFIRSRNDAADGPFSDNDRGRLVSMLNRLLTEPDLYDSHAMQSVNLPREALATLRRMSGPTAEDGNPVTDYERRRFNRFVLEGVFGRELSRFYRRGWRPIMWIYGFSGIFVAALFWLLFREIPEVHPWCNKSERALIQQGRSSAAAGSPQKLDGAPMKALLTSGNMWLCCVGQWGTNIGWLFVFTWLPRYLMEMHQVPIIQRGYMTMTPALVGMLGMFCGGRLTDVIAARMGVKWGRRIPMASSRMTALLAYLGAILLSSLPTTHAFNSPWVFTILFSVVAFSTDFGTAPIWAFNQDIGGRHIGSVLGWGNMWGNLGAAVAPLIYGFYLGENPGLHEWNMMFGICAASFAISGICFLLIDASKPLLSEVEASDSGAFSE